MSVYKAAYSAVPFLEYSNELNHISKKNETLRLSSRNNAVLSVCKAAYLLSRV